MLYSGKKFSKTLENNKISNELVEMSEEIFHSVLHVPMIFC
jgi:hypothetical protein